MLIGFPTVAVHVRNLYQPGFEFHGKHPEHGLFTVETKRDRVTEELVVVVDYHNPINDTISGYAADKLEDAKQYKICEDEEVVLLSMDTPQKHPRVFALEQAGFEWEYDESDAPEGMKRQ